jgi:hypothetical protein
MFILLTGLGDWIDTNLGVVLVLIGQVIGMAVAIAVLRFQVNMNKTRIDEHDDELDRIVQRQDKHREDYKSHLADANMHVNHLHMRSVEKRIDSLENTMNNGNREILSKIDGLAKSIYSNGKA